VLLGVSGLLGVGLLGGCFFGPGDDFGGTDGGGLADSTEADRGDYISLQRRLDERRSEALGEDAGELAAVGNVLLWLDFSAFDPTLHSLAGGAGTAYAFSIGSGNEHNYRASAQAIATAEPDGGSITYRLYAAGQPETLLGEAVFDAPGDEQRWWAYAVEGQSLYVVTTGAETTLHRYDPGGVATPVTTLESAGCEVGELWDFGVDAGVMVLVESGRLWRLDLGSNTCTFLGNDTEVSGSVDFRADGVLYESATGPFFASADGSTLDVAQAILASPYRLNETYASSHLYASGLARFGAWVVYVGQSGVFAYQRESHEVAPILLHPIDGEVRVDYRYPVVLDDGTLFVTGLTSTSGAVGADGPVFRVDLAAVLP
jgi:hypothetical protein